MISEKQTTQVNVFQSLWNYFISFFTPSAYKDSRLNQTRQTLSAFESKNQQSGLQLSNIRKSIHSLLPVKWAKPNWQVTESWEVSGQEYSNKAHLHAYTTTTTIPHHHPYHQHLCSSDSHPSIFYMWGKHCNDLTKASRKMILNILPINCG